MADSNKRKAGKDTAGGAAFKKKKVSRGTPCPRLNMAPQHDGHGASPALVYLDKLC